MLNADEINREIADLESQQTTYAVIQKLSWLYTVKDHLSHAEKMPSGESEFMKVCCGKSVCDVMEIMNELMEVLLVIQPRLYEAVLEKLTTELTTKH